MTATVTATVPLLVQVLRAPGAMVRLDLLEWDMLLRQALAANLTPTLYSLAARDDVLEALPAQPRRHLEWAGAMLRRHGEGVRFEVDRISAALAKRGVPILLLKGAAYAMAGLPPAQGRLFSDIDILVPHAEIEAVESSLMLAGWASQHQDPYDQRYYRQWMHEIPPMQHLQRGGVIDVHHAILPLTARARPDPESLRARAVAVPGSAGLHMLAPADMVIHSATHLFYDGEFDKGLRDLLDLHLLLAHFGGGRHFWEELAARAYELELERPLFYALRHCARVLETPLPPRVMAALAPAAPNRILLMLMDALFERALRPPHESCNDAFSASARFLLYIRGNWLRMPPLLLLRHLFHKAFISPKNSAG